MFAQLQGIYDQEIKWSALGVNYYISGQNLRLTLEYSINDYSKEDAANKDFTAWTAMLQFRIRRSTVFAEVLPGGAIMRLPIFCPGAGTPASAENDRKNKAGLIREVFPGQGRIQITGSPESQRIRW